MSDLTRFLALSMLGIPLGIAVYEIGRRILPLRVRLRFRHSHMITPLDITEKPSHSIRSSDLEAEIEKQLKRKG